MPPANLVFPTRIEIQNEFPYIKVHEPWNKTVAGDLNKIASEIATVYWGGRILKVGKNKGEIGKTPDPVHVETVKMKVKSLVNKMIKEKEHPQFETFKTASRTQLAASMGMLKKWKNWLSEESATTELKKDGKWA